eukprot:7925301-Alexandrium_andersonii.AAC.1
MSASLVGSEMCIRDRARVVWRRTQPGVGGPEGSETDGGGTGPPTSQEGGCLLYTSDAADDM